jgi:two-component system chemotaxis response regulator CheB
VVVIGGSAGGIDALQRVLAELPAGLPAAVLVVVHTRATAPGRLPEVLGRQAGLPAAHAVDGERLEPGTIKVAPPDRHLTLDSGGVVRVWHGPRENRCRPAIDPLFRSVARHRGRRVIAIVLSGLLDDGANGAASVRAADGVVLVQHPDDARFGSMPAAALSLVPDARVLPAGDIGRTIVRLVGEPDGPAEHHPPNGGGGDTDVSEHRLDKGGEQPASILLGCPECNGGLAGVDDGRSLRYVCHVGHSYSPDTLMAGQAEEIESALWMAVSKLEEHAAIQQRMAERAVAWASSGLADRWRESAADSLRAASLIRQQVVPYTLERLARVPGAGEGDRQMVD